MTFLPIATTGDVLPGGTRFESIPDGIALRTRGQGRVVPVQPDGSDRVELAERLLERRGLDARDNVAPAGPDFTYKRNGGQLVLVRIPGA